MKKTFIILIGLLTVASIFATASTVPSSATGISNTTVRLRLNDDYATVWFSRGANKEAIPAYALSLKNPGSLKQDTSGNGQDDKIYAASDAVSDSVYLKNGSIYGEGGSKQITIVTDNVWGKNKTKEYSAVLYAEITTT